MFISLITTLACMVVAGMLPLLNAAYPPRVPQEPSPLPCGVGRPSSRGFHVASCAPSAAAPQFGSNPALLIFARFRLRGGTTTRPGLRRSGSATAAGRGRHASAGSRLRLGPRAVALEWQRVLLGAGLVGCSCLRTLPLGARPLGGGSSRVVLGRGALALNDRHA